VRVVWQPQSLYDQCGIVIYQDSENWFKCAVEYDNPEFSRLGSVVTNLGYSDWATTDVDTSLTDIFYRLSRRGQDFLIEFSEDGMTFQQMRIFHMHHPSRRSASACLPAAQPGIHSQLNSQSSNWGTVFGISMSSLRRRLYSPS
jgi:hypothetical protein